MKRRRVQPNCHAWLNVITNSQPTRPADALRITNIVRAAFQRMRDGAGEDGDFNTVGAALNVGLVRAEAIDPQVEHAFKAAGEALLESERIRLAHGKFGFTGPGMGSINDALDVYEQILRLSTPLQMDAAAKEAARRVRAGHVVTATQ